MSWVMVVGGGAFARAHVHLQTRLRISGTTAPIVLKFGFQLGVHIPISQVCTFLLPIPGITARACRI